MRTGCGGVYLTGIVNPSCRAATGFVRGICEWDERAEGIHIGSGDDTAVAIYHYDHCYAGHLCNGKTDQLQQP